MPDAPFRGMHVRWIVLGLGCALALACDDDIDAMPAPFCADGLVCPEGTRCVDGAMCVAVDGAQDRREPPRFDLFRPPRTPPQRPPGQRDAGTPDFDGGVRDGGPRDDGGVFDQCLPGQAACTGGCANLNIDPNNCGGCGIVCPQGQLCTFGVCCDATGVVCGDECVDVFTDRNNCGVCGFACELGTSCVLGQCSPDDVPPGVDGPPGF